MKRIDRILERSPCLQVLHEPLGSNRFLHSSSSFRKKPSNDGGFTKQRDAVNQRVEFPSDMPAGRKDSDIPSLLRIINTAM